MEEKVITEKRKYTKKNKLEKELGTSEHALEKVEKVKKVNNAAKEVMLIKKSKGITLKEAWDEYKNTKKE